MSNNTIYDNIVYLIKYILINIIYLIIYYSSIMLAKQSKGIWSLYNILTFDLNLSLFHIPESNYRKICILTTIFLDMKLIHLRSA